MKKASLLLTLVLIFSIMTSGCSSGSNNSSQGGQSTQSSGNKVVTLKFMGWEASPLETKSVKNGLDIFMKNNPNIKVEYTTVPGSQYASKLMTMMAGNAAPDVFFAGNDIYKAIAKKGQLLDITKNFQNKYKYEDFTKAAIDCMRVDGNVYGIISCIVSPVLYYNKNIFDKAGLEYPPSDPAKAWTWEQFRDVAKKLTIKNGDKVEQYGAYGFEAQFPLSALIYSNGGRIFNDNYNQMVIDNPEAKEVFKKVLDLRIVDGAAPDAVTLEKVGMKAAQMLQTGKVAMLADGSWALQELATMGFPVGVAVLPKFKNLETVGSAHIHSAWAKTPYPEEAWKLIDFLSSDEYQCQNIKEGLWMPNRTALYTPEGMQKWYTEKIYGASFKSMVNYFKDAKVNPFAVLEKNKVNDIYTTEIDSFFHGGKDIDTVLATMQKKANEEFAKKD